METTGTNAVGRTLTYGEKAVGLTFNPSNDPTVQKLKELYAEIIDLVVSIPVNPPANGFVSEKTMMLDQAVRYAQTAQMWAVKVATSKD